MLREIRVTDGTTVTAGEVLALLEEGDGRAGGAPAEPAAEAQPGNGAAEDETAADGDGGERRPAAERSDAAHKLSPAVRRLLEEHDLEATVIEGSGRAGRVTKSDVMDYLKRHHDEDVTTPDEREPDGVPREAPGPERGERRVPMTRLRARIAERMVEAQHTAAMLTTFNEVDLTEVMALRSRYREAFEKEHGVRLGFMSFFVKAAVEALKKFPVVNASVEGSDVVYHDYFDIGIAVSSERGLMVPVVRDVDRMDFASIEREIERLGKKARDGSISMDELTGGTFTITNGGVFGSLLSTPILNPPQSGILGMHTIQKRPMVVGDDVAVRSMMYVALTYDHRIIDGREAVQFLVSIKNSLEDPGRMLLQL